MSATRKWSKSLSCCSLYRLFKGILPCYLYSFSTVSLLGVCEEEWSSDPSKTCLYPLLALQTFASLMWLGLTVLTLWVTKYQLHSWRAAIPTLLRVSALVSGPSAASETSKQVRSHKLWWQTLYQVVAFGLESHVAFNPLSCGSFVGLSLTNAYLFFLKAHRVSEAKTEPSYAFLVPTGMTSGILQLQHEWGHLMV